MTVLDVLQGVAPKIGLSRPEAVYGSTDRKLIELGDFANEVAEAIAWRHDWTLLKSIQTYTGDGATEDFDLPSDFQRFAKSPELFLSTNGAPLEHVESQDQWLSMDISNTTSPFNRWIVYGGQVHIQPALDTGITVKHWYMSNLIVAPNSGSNKTSFTADTDSFRLDDRLLRLGVIWKWRETKGLAYAEALEAFEDAFSEVAGADGGPAMLKVGRGVLPPGTSLAYPWPLGA